ncbi:MAG: ankyrin repeat domain-containing protein, partial [Victivallales bacterium]|nr:ankyrin repeat domain-containing protein [Victivallales bacterium]
MSHLYAIITFQARVLVCLLLLLGLCISCRSTGRSDGLQEGAVCRGDAKTIPSQIIEDDDEDEDDEDDEDDEEDKPKQVQEPFVDETRPFFMAAVNHDLAKVKELYRNDHNALNEVFGREEDFSYSESMSDFIIHSTDLNEPDSEGVLPLCHAIDLAFNKDEDDDQDDEQDEMWLVKLLIEHGANINGVASENIMPPVLAAIENDCSLEYLKKLVKLGVDLKEADRKYNFASHIDFCSADIVEFIYANGGDPNRRDDSGRTPLYYARTPETVDILLKAGASPHVKDAKGVTPMQDAIVQLNYPKVKRLLAAGVSRKGLRLLSLAAAYGDLEMVKTLLEEGEDPNECDPVTDQVPLFDLFFFESILEIEPAKQEAVARCLIEHGADVTQGDSLRMIAAHGSLGLLRDALKTIDAASVQELWAHDLLEGAAMGGNLENLAFVLETLNPARIGENILKDALSAGAGVGSLEAVRLIWDKVPSINENVGILRNTAYIAAYKKDTAILRFLLEASSKWKYRPVDCLEPALFATVESGNLEGVKLLAEHGADVSVKGYTRSEKLTLLMAAIDGDNLEIVRYLLEKGADVKAKEHNGKTVMHHAAAKGNVAVMTLLLEYGAEEDITNRDGILPVEVAAREGNLAAFQMLLKAYSGERRQAILDKTLDKTLQTCNRHIVKYILDLCCEHEPTKRGPLRDKKLFDLVRKNDLEKLKRLVEDGADIQVCDSEGNTLLDVAFTHCSDTIDYLINHGATIRTTRPSLWSAQSGLSKTIVEYLLKNGADVNEIWHDDDGITPIFFGDDFSVLKALVEAGADVNHHSKGWGTPLHHLV